ncbi:hypothetical protein Fmac_009317 [Flemingia macrophylla]|uniref:Uncharacterized protein n=1 Tax=Flemingia macrophylla TaxID=520843 RepID=A0ABD1MZX3_9FABA
MEEFPERGDLRRMQREQDRERRRIRDRQRRQSMTQEQRERHLARRRRNYQLRRQRAANAHAHAPYTPHLQPLESSAGEASTSDEFQGVTSSNFLDYGVLSQGIGFPHYGLNQGQETLNFGAKVGEGSRTKSMRLNCVKRLARSKNSPPKVTASQKVIKLQPEEIQLLENESFITSS